MLFPHGLKINISVNLAILLGIAMLLIDFVMLTSAQKILLSSEIGKGHLFISAIESQLKIENMISRSVFNDNMDSLLYESKFSCAMILDKNTDVIYSGGPDCALREKLGMFASESVRSGERNIRTSGTVWGVFWKQREHLILTAPLFRKGDIVAGVGIVLPLEGIYVLLRGTQHILLIYILINTVVLTFIGLYQLSKVTVKPLHDMLRRAEDYREETEFFFLGEKENDEFSQLSKALNRMLKQISDDKKALCLTVQSLEKANADLKQAQNNIIRAEKLASVGRLSSGIAHEIGNPLTIVKGYLELLERKDLTDDEKNDFIIRSKNEINRITRIIRQLLDFSRPSDGTLKTVSVHELIDDITEVLRFQPLMSDIHLTLSLAAEKDAVMADPYQLRQVFLNLAINAADAIASIKNKSDGRLIIASEVASDSDRTDCPPLLKLMFTDNGSGIPEGELGNIFDPFYTTKEPGKGTGLGLSVSFMIIEAMGGRIEASSEPDKGTTMAIYLPLAVSCQLSVVRGQL
ncbi:ATP-binding protein [Desulfobacterales bacterium HSG2]|nr:ATP-binding protein [Desulfobacterales bacterium HSG2]